MLVAESLAAGAIIARPSAPSPAAVTVAGRDLHLIDMGADAGLLTRVRADMGGAVAAVERFWGADWPRDIVVVATGTDTEFAAQSHLDPDRQWNDIAAVAVADDVDATRRQASGQRIVLSPGAAGMSEGALRIVLAHELFHYAARADTAPDAPRWLAEGVADYVARPPAPIPPGAAATPSLPGDGDLDRPGPDRSAGYDRAWWFARFVADTYGADGLRRLYDRACGPGHGDLATAVRLALGTDLAELQTRWAVWLEG